MGKKRISVLGSEEETSLKAKKSVKLEQKKLREGKSAKAPGLAGGQRVVDTTAESLAEFEEIQKRSAAAGVPQEAETKPKKAVRIRSLAYKSAKAKVDVTKTYPVSEAIKLLKDINLTHFDPTVELHINLTKSGVTAQAVLPYSTGKTKKIGVVDAKFLKSLESGNPDLNLDVLLASPAQMPQLVKFAKVLGPKGLMPNPKNGTIVSDPEAAAKKMTASDTVTLRTEKSAPLVHTIVGKLSRPEKELAANIAAVITSLIPSGITKVVLKSTMSPAIKLQI